MIHSDVDFCIFLQYMNPFTVSLHVDLCLHFNFIACIASRFMSSFQFHCMYCFAYFTKTLYCSQHQILSHLWQDLMLIKNKQKKNKEETLPDCVVSNDWISSLACYYILECEIKYSLKCIYL